MKILSETAELRSWRPVRQVLFEAAHSRDEAGSAPLPIRSLPSPVIFVTLVIEPVSQNGRMISTAECKANIPFVGNELIPSFPDP